MVPWKCCCLYPWQRRQSQYAPQAPRALDYAMGHGHKRAQERRLSVRSESAYAVLVEPPSPQRLDTPDLDHGQDHEHGQDRGRDFEDKRGKDVLSLSSLFARASLVQRLLPAQFSVENDVDMIDPAMVCLNVYRLKDSDLGFYHSGLVFCGVEYTYCQGIGICYHRPSQCSWAHHLGYVRLGYTQVDETGFERILKDMHSPGGGFSPSDYDVMGRSCNTFTLALTRRLGLESRYPQAVLKQSRIGEALSPVARWIDRVCTKSRSCANVVSVASTSTSAPTSSLSSSSSALAKPASYLIVAPLSLTASVSCPSGFKSSRTNST